MQCSTDHFITMTLFSGSLSRLYHPVVTIRSIVLHSGVVRNSLVKVRTAAQRLEDFGLGQLRKFSYRRSRCLLLGGGVVSASATKEGLRAEEAATYDWAAHTPSKETWARYYREIDQVHRLTLETLTCSQCGLRLRIESEVPDVSYCACPGSPKSVYGVEGPEGWSPFLERKDILVWRRPHSDMKGMWEYKMYGSFGDVTADEFLFVQNDLSKFRKSWDTSTKQLSLLEECGTSSVYYWEVNWPRFFSNRDYCCHRSVQTDPSSSTTACVSTSTQHPSCQQPWGTVRVSEYQSVLTVRPRASPDRPGLEFCLTGCENPGVSLPEAIVTWVAIRGMPEFMQSLRAACHRLRKEREDYSGSWGRQEDNFGQLHQRQAAYA